jgi:hypothetical protein
MKGKISLPILLGFASILILLIVLVPLKYLTAPLVRVVQYEETHDNSQMILITLLSSTSDGKTIQELIGEHIVFGNPNINDLDQIIAEKLDKLVESECYRLSTSSEILAESSDCNPQDYEKEAFVSLPYNSDKLTEKLTLVIN